MFRLFSRTKPKKSKKAAKARTATRGPASDRAETGKSAHGSAASGRARSPDPSGTGRKSTPERERIIREALEIHASQSKVLDALDDDLKEKLRALALETFLGDDRKKR